jgi:HJR/Mrr/RecB family endonuclease
MFVRQCGRTNRADFGGDITARGFLFTKIVVQCKCYSKPVGVKAVMEVNAARRYYHASRAAVATNNTFTKQAKELARHCGVELWENY